MKRELFSDFLRGGDALRVYCQGKLVFTSDKPGVLPLLEYATRFAPHEKDVTVFDRVVGNAAALLLSRVSCREVYSPLGSQLAGETLRGYGISYHFTETVPFIQNRERQDMCPMERLSLGKDPEEFYQACLSLGLGDKL
ncbi:MAG: DUF1893 domain-containing protein [Dehalococcoidia bacterium]